MQRFVFLPLLLLAACDSSLTHANPTFSVEITAPPTKPNGKPWDNEFGKSGNADPDITICWTDPEASTKETCIEREAANRRGCNNTTKCQIAFVPLPEKRLYFYIIDLDLAENDSIAQGYCVPSNSCTFMNTSLSLVKDTAQ